MRLIPITHSPVDDSEIDYNQFVDAVDLDDFDAALNWLETNPTGKAVAVWDGVARSWTTASATGTVTNSATPSGRNLDTIPLALGFGDSNIIRAPGHELTLGDTYRDSAGTHRYYALELFVEGYDLTSEWDLYTWDNSGTASNGTQIGTQVAITIAGTTRTTNRKLYIVEIDADVDQILHAQVVVEHDAAGSKAETFTLMMRAAKITNQSTHLSNLLAYGGAWTTANTADAGNMSGDTWDQDGAEYGFSANGSPTHRVDTPEPRVNAMEFDGLADYFTASSVDVDETDAAKRLDAFTAFAAVKVDNSLSAAAGYIFDQRGDSGGPSWVLLFTAGTLRLQVWNTSATLATINYTYPTDNAWHYVWAQYDGSEINIWVDSKPGTAVSASGTIRQDSPGTLYMGAATGPSNYITGQIAVPGVLDTSLADTERKFWHCWAQSMLGIDFGNGSTEEVGALP